MNTPNYRHPTTLALAARVIFAVITLPLVSYGWQAGASPTAPCLAVGQVFGWDIVEHTISLQSDSGHYSDVRYDDSTVLTDGEATLSTPDLNMDDRLCVQAFHDN